MSSYLNRVERQSDKLQKQLDELTAKEEEVRGLLAKADQKRRAPGEDARKWAKVLTNLEYTLDDVRRRRNALEVESNKSRQSLAWAREHPGETPKEDDTESARTQADEEAHPRAMNLEEMAALEGELDGSGIRQSEETKRRLEAKIEYANQTAKQPVGEAPNRRRQEMLRAAVDKIQARDFGSLSRDELQMTIATHSLLTRRLELDESDKRLLAMLGEAVTILREHLSAKKRQ